jgi:Kef-type K+ transport system membrane component KefB
MNMRSNNRTLIPYITMLVVFVAIIYGIIEKGRTLETNRVGHAQTVAAKANLQNNIQHFTGAVQLNLHKGLPLLLLQIMTIILVAWFFGWLFKKMGQPAVIGEIAAGIALGPSLLGLALPGVSAYLFPESSVGNLQFLSQLGLVLFMFIIGMELDLQVIRKQAFGALVISHASIIIPFTFGVALSFFLYQQYATDNSPFLSFALFMGIAMSITAFPVLARILQEKNMTSTRLGTMALTAAALGDVTGWCILAMLIAIINAGSSVSALFTVSLVIVYSLIMLFLVRPMLKKLQTISHDQKLGRPTMAILFVTLLLSSFVTEAIGIHALFGAFMAGIMMPTDPEFRKHVINRIEDLSIVLLLPLFFVMTGLRTRIDSLIDGSLWIPFIWILIVAVSGKFGGTAVAARLVGQNWKDSVALGALMNSRGLMELIVLNIGYDLGIISSQVFSMLVLMALITTLMTSPLLTGIEKLFHAKTLSSPADAGPRLGN